jgi:phage shock protein PspC (stress-responsive transcriptional regulator)
MFTPRKFYVSRRDSYIGGVCGGLEEYTGIDSLLWRILFVCLAKWLLVPYLMIWFFSSPPPSGTSLNV